MKVPGRHVLTYLISFVRSTGKDLKSPFQYLESCNIKISLTPLKNNLGNLRLKIQRSPHQSYLMEKITPLLYSIWLKSYLDSNIIKRERTKQNTNCILLTYINTP